MNIQDKLDAARHSLTGSNISKIASKASSREIMGPKKKHIDYLVQCTNEDNVSIPNLADVLFERCTNSNWTVVFKSLVTFHHLMSYGNERFVQYLASRTTNFNLHNFLDKNGLQGVDMSNFIRRYSCYLNEKASCYLETGYDFCRAKRGKEDGVLRTMDQTKLLKALPIMQKLLDSLLSVDITSGELNNGVVNSAFLMLFKDLIRLFACYNDGIINLLEKYFDMPKKNCKEALEVYKRFLFRMDKVSDFLKVAEDVGINKGDIPDLTKAPSSLLEALENHLQSLEKGNKPASQPPKTITLAPISVPSFSTSSDVFGSVTDSGSNSEISKQQLIEEEAQHLEAFKAQHLQNQSPQLAAPPQRVAQQQTTFTPQLTPPQPTAVPRPSTSFQAPAAPAPAAVSVANNTAQNDLLQLNQVFSVPQNSAPQNFAPVQSMPVGFPPVQTAPGAFPPSGGQMNAGMMPGWGSGMAAPNQGAPAPFGFGDTSFNTGFPADRLDSGPVLGDVLQPTVPGQPCSTSTPSTPSDAQVQGKDLNSSLARVAMSLDNMNFTQTINPGKDKHQWTAPPPQVKTGGNNWQPPSLARSTFSGGGSGMQPAMTQPTLYGAPAFQQPRMPGTFVQPGMVSPQPIGGMFQQQAFQQQAAIVQDPFGPVPGTQARF